MDMRGGRGGGFGKPLEGGVLRGGKRIKEQEELGGRGRNRSGVGRVSDKM